MLDESEIDSSVNSILVGVVLVVLEEKGKVCWPTMFGPDIFPFLPDARGQERSLGLETSSEMSLGRTSLEGRMSD